MSEPSQQPQYPQYPQAPPVDTSEAPIRQPSSVLAVVSLVLSLLGLLVFGVFAIGGVIAGHLARAKIKRGEAAGSSMATAGLVVGYIAIAINAVVLVLLLTGVIEWSDLGFS